MDFGEVLSRAWQIIWKHKVLWIFGILAGCVNSGSSTGNAFNRGDQTSAEMQRFFTDTPREVLIGIIIAVVIVTLLLIVLVIFLGTIGRIGMIRGTQQVEGGAERLAFGELFRGSMPYFWRVFLLNLLVGIAVFLVLLAVILVTVGGSVFTLGIAAVCLVPLLCVFLCLMVPASWAIQVVVTQSSNAIVIEDLGIMDGLRRGWEVVRTNVGAMVIMWLILVVGITLIGGFILGLPFLLIVSPALIGVIAGGDQALMSGILVAALCFVAYLPVLLVLNGILRSYVEASWTLTFMRLTRPSAAPPEPQPLPEPAA